MLTFLDGFANGAQFRINGSAEVSDSYSWFVPALWGGSHDIKFGGQYIYSTIELPDQTDMNGRFQFSTDLAFNPNNFRTYPERLFIRVPAASASFLPTHVGVLFAQDKWAIGNLTVNLGLRYDIEATPMPNDFNPSFTKGNYPVDKNNLSPRVGLAWRPGGSATQLVRGGWGLFYDKITLITTTPFLNQGVFSDSFVAAFPTDRADAGPSTGSRPTEPVPGERPGRESRRDQRAVPAWIARPEYRRRLPRQPRPQRAEDQPADDGIRAAARGGHGRHGRLRAQLEPESADHLQPESGNARQHVAHRRHHLYRSRGHREPAWVSARSATPCTSASTTAARNSTA